MSTTEISVWTGWKLTALISVLLVILAAVAVTMSPSSLEATRLVIRLTARTSLVLFALAFTASSLDRLFPSPATRWLRQNRRYLGVSFAVSHAIHAVALFVLARLDSALFLQLTDIGSYIGGGIAYLFIILMTLTSFDRTAVLIGPTAWYWLHTVGAWYIWVSFLLNFGKRAAMNPMYWPAMVIVGLMLVVRLAAVIGGRRRMA
ncbi:ferric reductase-like transmembrane domain-containing protein [Oryzicola mucosus]|uniref:Ferric reductase-like transmembrane domain-containing protein n=1 Tax=Oryzicola mucosus TaxID=2767425 RepID=A0A8J6U0E2_9HYPH|nr:ferric reductase-like transmembrane domain-containing protein [Oryzicola mucosus]MBD0417474.1 ferric reductase-like transmembrane domain-containing protein [Oryzicola mucosus]